MRVRRKRKKILTTSGGRLQCSRGSSKRELPRRNPGRAWRLLNRREQRSGGKIRSRLEVRTRRVIQVTRDLLKRSFPCKPEAASAKQDVRLRSVLVRRRGPGA